MLLRVRKASQRVPPSRTLPTVYSAARGSSARPRIAVHILMGSGSVRKYISAEPAVVGRWNRLPFAPSSICADPTQVLRLGAGTRRIGREIPLKTVGTGSGLAPIPYCSLGGARRNAR
jgi:hypothetical protein